MSSLSCWSHSPCTQATTKLTLEDCGEHLAAGVWMVGDWSSALGPLRLDNKVICTSNQEFCPLSCVHSTTLILNENSAFVDWMVVIWAVILLTFPVGYRRVTKIKNRNVTVNVQNNGTQQHSFPQVYTLLLPTFSFPKLILSMSAILLLPVWGPSSPF